MEDKDTKEKLAFSFDRWFALDMEDGDLSRELPVVASNRQLFQGWIGMRTLIRDKKENINRTKGMALKIFLKQQRIITNKQNKNRCNTITTEY